MGSPISYGKFSDMAAQMHLYTRECAPNHWQASANGATVNVWPQSGGRFKYLLQGSPGKAKLGTIEDVLRVCAKHAAATPPVNGAPKPASNIVGLAAATNMAPGIRNRVTVMMDESGAFTVISHGDAVEQLTFDEMLGMVVNVFHTPKQKTRAETLFAHEKSSGLRFRATVTEPAV